MKETIARQAEEIERLRRRLAQESTAQELRAAFTQAAAAAAIASPVSHVRLIEMIVETAAHVISAQAAALLLIDEATQELTFEVVLGGSGEALRQFRLPLGHGIAGLVAVSGQPLTVTDASNDPRQAADIATAVGYRPKSILCVPLWYEDRILGVLELLDKEGASSFSTADMATLGLFANQAAIAIAQSRVHQSLAALLRHVLAGAEPQRGQGSEEASGVRRQASVSDATDQLRQTDASRLTPDACLRTDASRLTPDASASAFAAQLEEDPAFRQALELARLVQEIAWEGEHEVNACRTILRGFAEYLRTRSRPLDAWGAM